MVCLCKLHLKYIQLFESSVILFCLAHCISSNTPKTKQNLPLSKLLLTSKITQTNILQVFTRSLHFTTKIQSQYCHSLDIQQSDGSCTTCSDRGSMFKVRVYK